MKWELSLLHVKHLLVLIFIPTKYKSNPLKNNNFEKKLTWDDVRRLTPKACPPRHRCFKGQIFEKTCPKMVIIEKESNIFPYPRPYYKMHWCEPLTHCSLQTSKRVNGKKADQDQMPQNMVSPQGLHCLQIVQPFFLFKYLNLIAWYLKSNYIVWSSSFSLQWVKGSGCTSKGNNVWHEITGFHSHWGYA